MNFGACYNFVANYGSQSLRRARACLSGAGIDIDTYALDNSTGSPYGAGPLTPPVSGNPTRRGFSFLEHSRG